MLRGGAQQGQLTPPRAGMQAVHLRRGAEGSTESQQPARRDRRGRGGAGRGGGRKSKGRNANGDEEEEEEDEDEEDEEEGEEEASDVVVAIARKGQVLGMACFNEIQSTIVIAQILASGDFREIIQSLKMHLEPNIILIDPFTMQNEDFCKLLSSSVSEDRKEYELRVIKTRNWETSVSMKNICRSLVVKELRQAEDHDGGAEDDEGRGGRGGLMMLETGGNLYERRVYDRLSSIFDFKEETQIVRALGALVVHLQSSTFQLEAQGRVPVKSITRFDLGNYVRLDSTAFSSLQVFHTEAHPNVISGKGRAKEGFSLFGLLDQTKSRPGRAVLKEWLMKPLRSLEEIVKRQEAIELFMQPECSESITNVKHFLAKIADVARCLARFRQVIATYRDWLKLHQTIQNSMLIHNCLVALHQNAVRVKAEWSDVLQSLAQRINFETLTRAHETVNRVIDIELTKETKEVAIRHGAYEDLDRLKAALDDLEELLTNEARNVLDQQPRLQSLSVQYLPQIGYLVVISSDQRGAVAEDQSFRFIFAQEDRLYYKTPRMHFLDDNVGDLQATIHDIQDRLLRELGDAILDEEVPLTEAVRACAELDALISMAQIAQGLNWSRPQLTEERVIIVKDGRHPLQEVTVDSYVPNDVYLTRERALAIVTGPNYSGKSVYIKQVATAVFLAHVGSFIPCDRAIIGLTDAIYTRISSFETCTVQQSTFTIDLLQMNTIFKNATEHSLVIVDEFGKGSAEIDGQALLVAAINELQRLEARTLITTHFLEVLHDDNLIPRQLVEENCYRMDVHIPPQDRSSNQSSYNTIVPLFKLTKGTATASDGLSCAVLAGLSVPLVRRAEHIIGCHMAGKQVEHLPCPLLQLGGSDSNSQEEGGEEKGLVGVDSSRQGRGERGGGGEPSNVIRYNKAAMQTLERFLEVEDWTGVNEEELQGFMSLLRSASCCCRSTEEVMMMEEEQEGGRGPQEMLLEVQGEERGEGEGGQMSFEVGGEEEETAWDRNQGENGGVDGDNEGGGGTGFWG